MSPPSRPRALATTACFVVADLTRSIAFYEKLGFGEPGVWGDPPCFAMLNRDLFGMIEAEVSDPDGHRICFGQDL